MSQPARIELEPHVRAVDVMRQLGCVRSTAYEHLRRAARREPGARGLLSVPLSMWTRYCERLAKGAAQDPEPRRWVRPKRRRRSPGPVASGIYFVQVNRAGPIKIGQANDIQTRLADLQVGNPEPLRLLGVIRETSSSGKTRIERELHGLVREHWIAGEWFRCHGDVLALVSERAEPWEPST